ncbi:CCN family member 1-like isoform X2 [Petromyzon marinus]|uniref:CCN family member 1-like isoform X2 n=1 Tax=Petromyzon marinus TaxID=7757 RepID=UPI003F6E784B
MLRNWTGTFKLLISLTCLVMKARVVSSSCPSPCSCPAAVPEAPCRPGVPLVWDACGCCRVCAQLFNEDCDSQRPCDSLRGLTCDAGGRPPTSAAPGVCRALQEGRSCELGGRVYQHGESFSVSCTHRCSCVDGAAGCAPLCPRPRPPLPPLLACPRPLLRRTPGTNACCLEWDCGPSSAHSLESGGGGAGGSDDEVVADTAGDILKEGFKGVKTLAAFRGSAASRLLPPPAPPAARAEPLGTCRGEPSPGWSPCSASCGRGRATRLAGGIGDGCRPVRRTRACLVRPCARPSSPRHIRRHRGDGGVPKDHHRSDRHRHHRRRRRQRRRRDGGGCLVRPPRPAPRAAVAAGGCVSVRPLRVPRCPAGCEPQPRSAAAAAAAERRIPFRCGSSGTSGSSGSSGTSGTSGSSGSSGTSGSSGGSGSGRVVAMAVPWPRLCRCRDGCRGGAGEEGRRAVAEGGRQHGRPALSRTGPGHARHVD